MGGGGGVGGCAGGVGCGGGAAVAASAGLRACVCGARGWGRRDVGASRGTVVICECDWGVGGTSLVGEDSIPGTDIVALFQAVAKAVDVWVPGQELDGGDGLVCC